METVKPPAGPGIDGRNSGGTSARLVERFGLVVRRLRQARGWSQEELAERAELNRSYIGEIERGQVVASILTAQKLAQGLDTDVGTLIRHCGGTAGRDA